MYKKTSVEIDVRALTEWAKGTGESYTALSHKICRSDNYISCVLKQGRMSTSAYKFMLQVFNLPADSFKPKPPEPPKPEKPKVVIPPASAETGWQTRIKVQPDKVHFTVYFNGLEVVNSSAYIKEPRKELQLMQAISYAAHMAYKLMEQRKLRGEGIR